MRSAPSVILTPTARLARTLARENALALAAQGTGAWIPPAIQSFPAWLAHLRDGWTLDRDDASLPISSQQSLHLWQSLVDQSVFVGDNEVAVLAQRAWRLIHEHDLDPPERWPALLLSDDSRQFKVWAAAYRALCAKRGAEDEWSFAASLPRLVADGRIAAPLSIELVGFELDPTPLQQRILAAFTAAGSRVAQRPLTSHVTALPSIQAFEEPNDELAATAGWARRLLEAQSERSIAIVVPDLEGRVDDVERIFRRVFDPPAFALRGSHPEAWHVSLGRPLADWPLVGDALAILALDGHRLTQPQTARLVRSPFLPDWQVEARERARALAELARRAPYDLTTRELERALEAAGATVLATRVTAWHAYRRNEPASGWPSQWVARFQTELSTIGFGAGRPLDSREFQVLGRWHDLLSSMSELDVVCGAPVARARFGTMLADAARATVFREQNPGVPIEVLGVEEALGSRFDALWITALDADTWPGAARRHPLIPAQLQARVPRATSEGCLARAERELAALIDSAPIVLGSFARGREEIPRERTRLLRACTEEPAPAPVPPIPAAQEEQADVQAPPLHGNDARGGTSVLRNQAACPFRAFAESRLRASPYTVPRPGLDARQRGDVVHRALERFWQGRKGHTDLSALAPEDLRVAIEGAVSTALDAFTQQFSLVLTRAGRKLELRRTARVLERWLALERERGEFRVVAQERPLDIEIGGLRLRGKIDRLDALPDGGTMLIDYKTGNANKSAWFPEPRIRDPQLPAYALAMDPQPTAIAFARLKPDELGFEGLAEHACGTSGVDAIAKVGRRFKDINAWVDLLDGWQTHLEALARDFRDGVAAVDPRPPDACANCHLHALCRIHERAPFAGDDESADGEPDDE